MQGSSQQSSSLFLPGGALYQARTLLLASGAPLALRVVHALSMLGLQVHLIDLRGPSRVRHSRHLSAYESWPDTATGPAGAAATAERLRSYVDTRGIRVLLAADVVSSALLGDVKSRFSDLCMFPVADRATIEMLDDKGTFQSFCERSGIPCPAGAVAETVAEAIAIAERAGTDVMVKSFHGESGHGVRRCKSPAEVEAYLRGDGRHRRLPVLVQEWVDGVDADLSFLAIDGRVVTSVLQRRPDVGIIEFGDPASCQGIAERIALATGYSGVANVDLRLDDATGRALVLECNPRFWYTLPASFWRGLNFVECGLSLACGVELESNPPTNGLYFLHRHLFRRVLTNPRRWKAVTTDNLRGLLQAAGDPLPHLRRT